MDADVDHLLTMNELVEADRTEAAPPSDPMRVVEPLVVNPSDDLAVLASRFAKRMPRAIRFLLEGLGKPGAQRAGLMSYLLFDAADTRELVEIDYRDADERSDKIEASLATSA